MLKAKILRKSKNWLDQIIKVHFIKVVEENFKNNKHLFLKKYSKT